MKKFVKLLIREVKRFFKDTTLLTVFFGAPMLYALLLGFVYKSGKVTQQPIVVVQEEQTPLSYQLMEMLNDNEQLKIVAVLTDKIDLNDALIKHNAIAAVIIPNRFEASILQKKYPEVNVYINTTNLLTANMTSTALQVSLGSLNAGLEMAALQKQGMNAEQAALSYEPFKTNFIKLYNETGNYFTYMWPAFLAVILQQVILLAMAVSFTREVEENTFGTELYQQTKSPLVMLLVKVIPFWIFSWFILAMYYILHTVFGAPLPQFLFDFMVSSTLFIMASTFLGTMISALIPNALKATQILMVLAAPSFLIGGYSWPKESMPLMIQYIADLLPLTPFLEAHKAMLFQGANLSQVTTHLNHLMVLCLIYFLLSLTILFIKTKIVAKKLKNATA